MAESKRLTAFSVERLVAPGRYSDGHGLNLQITDAGVKSWLFRYQLHGRERSMGLGPMHTVGLADARKAALEARRLLLNKIDPLDARQSQRAQGRIEAARGLMFRDCADRLIAAQEKGWRNPKHRAQWRSTLATY